MGDMNTRNLIVAIALSLVILLGFQMLMPSTPEPPPSQTTQAVPGEPPLPIAPPVPGEAPVTGAPAAPGVPAQADDLGTVLRATTRDAALGATGRVEIDSPRVHGSISLTGARIDDLTLSDYRETVDPDSPPIVLLSPPETMAPYYVHFGWVGEAGIDTPTLETVWEADGALLAPGSPVTLSWTNDQGVTFRQRFSIDENYMVAVTRSVENGSGQAVSFTPFGRVSRFGTPETLGFFILHEGPYGVFDGTLRESSYSTLRDDGRIEYASSGGWMGFTDKYWLVALAPNQAVPVQASFDHIAVGGQNRYFATYAEPAIAVAPGDVFEQTMHVFAGAKEVRLMEAYGRDLGIEKFDLTVDFGWFYFLTRPFFYVLTWIHGLVGNFGIAIILMTFLIKAILFPLANKSYKSMSRMKALAPQMTALRDRYKGDRQRLNQEMMALYRREKVNPASGCLPILIQIPIFFALYKVLFVNIEMRHAPFFGWIRDLSVPDPTSIFNLFGLLPWTPPGFLMIGIWPLIMGVTMYLQQKLNPAPPDPIQAKIFMALPIVFTFILAGFPAGLVIYWATNNVLSMAQQWVIMKRMGVKIGGGVVAKPHEPTEREKEKAERRKSGQTAEPAPAAAAGGDGGGGAAPRPANANRRRAAAGGGSRSGPRSGGGGSGGGGRTGGGSKPGRGRSKR